MKLNPLRGCLIGACATLLVSLGAKIPAEPLPQAAAPAGQQIDLPKNVAEDDAALATAMPKLAELLVALYKEPDNLTYLNNLLQLQILADQYPAAKKTLASLRALGLSGGGGVPATYGEWQIYAGAKVKESEGTTFDEAFKETFREVVGPLDDFTAYRVIHYFGIPLDSQAFSLRQARDRQKGKTTISVADAVDLVTSYYAVQACRAYGPMAPALIDEDDSRRYIVQKDVLVDTPDGAQISAVVFRPKDAKPAPTLLCYTIYVDWFGVSQARLSATHGYASVVAYTRGKAGSAGAPVPYEHDGADASAVIDWIARQTWSDGRVGMYSGSYNGFTQWAAAKHMPKALKAIMPAVSAAPGIDVPMEGNAFLSFVYPWIPYTTNNKTLDDATYNDVDRWSKMSRTWYTSGKPYRSLDEIDGTPNPIFRRWLDHPSYDKYWQSMTAYADDFSRINIPVLTTTGYYDGGNVSALYYLAQHYKYNPKAEHYLVIGPYSHFGAQGRPQPNLRGYDIDPVARIDFYELRYQWFDYIFRGGKKPNLLKDKINYEVMGSNIWKHAPSLDAMSDHPLRFYLSAEKSGDYSRMSAQKPLSDEPVVQKIDFADRTDVDFRGHFLIPDKKLDTHNSIAFVSDAIDQPTEMSGLFSGRLEFETNKKDFDLQVNLYELTPDGTYFQLSWYQARASYVKDRSIRHLLTPGKREHLSFKAGRLTSKLLQKGSRLVAVFTILKSPNQQINYGTGKDVSDESIADAKEPLEIKWFGGSYIDFPMNLGSRS